MLIGSVNSASYLGHLNLTFRNPCFLDEFSKRTLQLCFRTVDVAFGKGPIVVARSVDDEDGAVAHHHATSRAIHWGSVEPTHGGSLALRPRWPSHQYTDMPPSAGITAAVIMRDSSDARNSATFAISCGSPTPKG